MTGPIPPRVAERAATRYIADDTGCFITTYSLGSHGYGQVGWVEEGVRQGTTAHRAAWTYHHGPIPDGLTVDHEVCRVGPCVNVEHLRLLPNGVNASDNGQVRSNPGVGRFCGCGEELVKGVGKQAYCRSCQNRRRRARRHAGKAN